jgi:hypothetical protein
MTNESKPFLKHMGTCFLQKPHQSLGNHSLMDIANEVGAGQKAHPHFPGIRAAKQHVVDGFIEQRAEATGGTICHMMV